MERAGRGQGGIAEVIGGGDGDFGVVGRELFRDSGEVDSDAGYGCGQRMVGKREQKKKGAEWLDWGSGWVRMPCRSRDVPSGTYLTSSLRRR